MRGKHVYCDNKRMYLYRNVLSKLMLTSSLYPPFPWPRPAHWSNVPLVSSAITAAVIALVTAVLGLGSLYSRLLGGMARPGHSRMVCEF